LIWNGKAKNKEFVGLMDVHYGTEVLWCDFIVIFIRDRIFYAYTLRR
jgi:hypothetical protein